MPGKWAFSGLSLFLLDKLKSSNDSIADLHIKTLSNNVGKEPSAIYVNHGGGII
jgi:hypothetical protein